MCKECRRRSVLEEQLRGVRELRIELEESEDGEADERDFNEEGDFDDE